MYTFSFDFGEFTDIKRYYFIYKKYFSIAVEIRRQIYSFWTENLKIDTVGKIVWVETEWTTYYPHSEKKKKKKPGVMLVLW